MTCSFYLVFMSTSRPHFPPALRELGFISLDSDSSLALLQSQATSSLTPALARCWKYPSSYPDFNTRPFCITTLTLPVNRSDNSNRSMDADSTSADFTFRRNSPKTLSSFELSRGPVMISSPGFYALMVWRSYACEFSRSRLFEHSPPVEIFLPSNSRSDSPLGSLSKTLSASLVLHRCRIPMLYSPQ